ncbi:MAG: gamma-glutamyl-gamma-aminobutyrate hydrolase family protein [Bacteroidota bacterium]
MILIINCGSQKTIYIEQAVDAVCDFQTIGMFELDSLDLNSFDGIIISGAPILITEVDTEKYLSTFSWIKNHEKPILGICFGHQMIGLLHGAFASRQKEDRDWQTIEQCNESTLFDKLANEFEMMEDHCECISIPSHFNLIASSDACVNEAMQHETKQIFGVQFHPEVSGNHGYLLLENFVNICLKNK